MIFKNQGNLKIRLDSGIDLSVATELKILYIKPDGTKGSYSADVFETTKAEYTFADSDLDQTGVWKFQVYCKIDGKSAFGDPYNQKVQENFL